MRIVGQNSDVHFGEVDEEEPDWREELEEETDPDDEELEYTPQDVIDILGFDPKEFSEPTSNKDSNVTLNTIRAQMILEANVVTANGGRGSGRKRGFRVKIKDPHENYSTSARRGTGPAKTGAVNRTRLKIDVEAPKIGSLSKKTPKGKKNRKFMADWLRTYRKGDPGNFDLLNNTGKALVVLNAKKASGVKNPKIKGWTDAARKKAALTRKAKSKVVKGKAGESNKKFDPAYPAKVAKAYDKAHKASQKKEERITKSIESRSKVSVARHGERIAGLSPTQKKKEEATRERVRKSLTKKGIPHFGKDGKLVTPKASTKSGESAPKKKTSRPVNDKPDYAKAVASAKSGGLYDSWNHTRVGKHKVKFAKIGDRYDAQSSTGMRVSGKTPEEALSKLILRPSKSRYA